MTLFWELHFPAPIAARPPLRKVSKLVQSLFQPSVLACPA